MNIDSGLGGNHGSGGFEMSLQMARLEDAVRQLGTSVQTLTSHVSSQRSDHTLLQQRVNQLGGGSVPPLLPASQLPMLPIVPSSSNTGLYARRLGLANFSQVDAAYQRDVAQFSGRLKAVLYDAFAPGRWSDTGVIQRIKDFFSTHGISVDLVDSPGNQDVNMAGATQSDLIVRAELVVKHLRAASYVYEHFVLYWTLLEICRQYGIYW